MVGLLIIVVGLCVDRRLSDAVVCFALKDGYKSPIFYDRHKPLIKIEIKLKLSFNMVE